MNDIGEELKRVVRDSGKSVMTISKETGVGYFKLMAFISGRVLKVDGRMAQVVIKSLTGRDLI